MRVVQIPYIGDLSKKEFSTSHNRVVINLLVLIPNFTFLERALDSFSISPFQSAR